MGHEVNSFRNLVWWKNSKDIKLKRATGVCPFSVVLFRLWKSSLGRMSVTGEAGAVLGQNWKSKWEWNHSKLFAVIVNHEKLQFNRRLSFLPTRSTTDWASVFHREKQCLSMVTYHGNCKVLHFGSGTTLFVQFSQYPRKRNVQCAVRFISSRLSFDTLE